jgi:G3E family GTPase
MGGEATKAKVPVTILTGFLGSGKTTLLNHILTHQHGKRIADIENEYGEINIDHGLVINADEEIYEVSNGCICCTVRGDLIRILGSLMKRRNKFDYVLVETTGLADPGPVAQTFFMDEDIQRNFELDGIVTVVDAKHLGQQLGRSAESQEQIAFADVLLLNKVDLVEEEELRGLEARLRSINAMARLYRTERGVLPVERLLGLRAFDLGQTLARRPTFLEPEYPFEWTGVFGLSEGRYELSLSAGPDPEMSVAWIALGDAQDATLRDGAEQAVRVYAEEGESVEPGGAVALGAHALLQLEGAAPKRFVVEVAVPGLYGLYAQHHADEFDLKLLDGAGQEVAPSAQRVWVAEHEHDDEVGSVAIEVDGDLDPKRVNAWIGELLQERGLDLFRMKGFLSLAGEERRFIFQGVHMLFDGQPDRPWGSDPRRNQLVFIGRNLDQELLEEGFMACLASAPGAP